MANELYHFHVVQAILKEIRLDSKLANLIATASQAIDDFYEDKLIVLDDGELFYPVVTAHRMLNLKNLDSRDASNIWMPFHFFPYYEGVCKPGSDNVKKLIDFVKKIDYKPEVERPLLYGILLHIFVDTYTHQNFMGLHCKYNDISYHDDKDVCNMMDYKRITANASPCIGHGEALSYPDDFWRKWSYCDNSGKKQKQDNPSLFMKITDEVCNLMKELGYKINDLTKDQRKNYKNIFSIKGTTKNYETVIKNELDSISKSYASATNKDEILSYKKWKNEVMRPIQSKENKYLFIVPRDDFYQSNWVIFQSLAKDVRTYFKNEIFPEIRVNTTVY